MHYSVHLLRQFRLTIGQNIQRLRTRQQLPLEALAELAKVPALLLERYERGNGEIRIEHLFRIACALEVETEILVR